MLSKLRVEHYKSLFEIEVDLEPLTVFIGPNGSGKSNICESLAVFSGFLQRVMSGTPEAVIESFRHLFGDLGVSQQNIESKFWHGLANYFAFKVEVLPTPENSTVPTASNLLNLSAQFDYPQQTVTISISKNEGFSALLNEGMNQAGTGTSQNFR
ncbi:MAG: AAA family ATPase [Acaryochloris sp. RU_4_1]|nr:AAA family ATPase [Acaryochloris sp. RU_4_1]NJR56914.1 AAA family ATPase [Acaryochloris sp. CRU_2_0]